MKAWIPSFVALCTCHVDAQTALQYQLSYPAAGASAVQVRIQPAFSCPAPLTMVVPRNYPGGYGLVPYDSFVDHVQAFSEQGKPLTLAKP